MARSQIFALRLIRNENFHTLYTFPPPPLINESDAFKRNKNSIQTWLSRLTDDTSKSGGGWGWEVSRAPLSGVNFIHNLWWWPDLHVICTRMVLPARWGEIARGISGIWKKNEGGNSLQQENWICVVWMGIKLLSFVFVSTVKVWMHVKKKDKFTSRA